MKIVKDLYRKLRHDDLEKILIKDESIHNYSINNELISLRMIPQRKKKNIMIFHPDRMYESDFDNEEFCYQKTYCNGRKETFSNFNYIYNSDTIIQVCVTNVKTRLNIYTRKKYFKLDNELLSRILIDLPVIKYNLNEKTMVN